MIECVARLGDRLCLLTGECKQLLYCPLMVPATVCQN